MMRMRHTFSNQNRAAHFTWATSGCAAFLSAQESGAKQVARNVKCVRMTGELMTSSGYEIACSDLHRYLANDDKVSIHNDQEKFLEIISRSMDSQVSETIVAEIKANHEKFTFRHLVVSFLCLVVLSCIAYVCWPRIKPQIVEGAWDELNRQSEPYEAKETLYKNIERALEND